MASVTTKDAAQGLAGKFQLTFRMRRKVSLIVTAIALAVVYCIAQIQAGRLAHASFFTGFTVLASILLLVLLGVRRRLPILPLGTVATWTQIHLYMGLFAFGVYAMHVPMLVAGGIFESGLSIVFLLVTCSGFYGIYASRTLPKRLTAVDGQHRFDHVGWHRAQIAKSARQLLDNVHEHSGMRVLGSFYTHYLNPFFESRPSLAYVMMPTGLRRRRLLGGLKELDRYLEDESRGTAGRLAALVRRRDDLDYQYALQLRLRLWVVVHSVFSIALVAAALVHAVIAWRHAG
ncbi:hypothetical protein K227x_44770 [Rubripirellula lacrimiformis]|uniref:Ferric reductase like transmembrane component n=1 Tax=Rubripirellula lacrimiformis TaxID=1930273 RepID=A0A517NG07_9BACT|nr:hypothetical protein [Rubripirellula lacrimiformis]QDT06070.1 hypothetical protein K227x_44770 [Rubripirellula lacrimiformis]